MTALNMTRGDTAVWRFTCTDQDDAVVDLAGATVTFTARPDPMGDVALELTLGSGIAVVNPALGLLDVTIQPDDGLQARTYKWDLELTYSPEAVYTVDHGLLHVAADVTAPGS
jgi:hypothetical protein